MSAAEYKALSTGCTAMFWIFRGRLPNTATVQFQLEMHRFVGRISLRITIITQVSVGYSFMSFTIAILKRRRTIAGSMTTWIVVGSALIPE